MNTCMFFHNKHIIGVKEGFIYEVTHIYSSPAETQARNEALVREAGAAQVIVGERSLACAYL